MVRSVSYIILIIFLGFPTILGNKQIYEFNGLSGNCSNGSCEDSDDLDPKCPPDSFVDPTDGKCTCDFRHCFPTPCRPPSQSVLRTKGKPIPGECCDVYDCVPPHDKNCSDVSCPEEIEKCPEDSYRLPSYKSPEACCLTPQNCKCLPSKCEQPTCPPGQHANIVRPGNGKPGTCCSLYNCVSDKKISEFCVYKDIQWPNNSTWHDGACSVCTCDNGKTFCRVLTSGNCTENPAGCISADDKLYKNGDSWEEDSCTHCTCVAGVKRCIAYMCETSCDYPVYKPGECCPFCNESSVVVMPANCSLLSNCSLKCRHGWVRDESGCYICECKAEPCLLKCLHGFAHDARGRILCECAEPEVTVSQKTGPGCPSASECRNYCSFGPDYSKEMCEKCKCKSDGCDDLTDCKKVCTTGFDVNEKGCIVCRCLDEDIAFTDDTTTAHTDRYHTTKCFGNDGSIHGNGETWHDGCRQCLCHEGVEMCNLVVCPRLNCVNPIFNSSTDCCAMCPDDLKKGIAPVKTVMCHSLDGSYKEEGEMWSIDQCTTCICHTGQILCDTRECPPTPCEKPIKNHNGCCPYCPNDTSFGEAKTGKSCGSSPSRSHGSSWKVGNCESCKCVNGYAICYTQECHLENCPHPVLQKNQCCNTCIEKMWQRSCRVGNSTFDDSDEWMEDECTQCVCNDGHIMCTKQICPVYCDNPVKKPGKCCPTCPDRGDSSSLSTNTVKIFIYNIIITILILVVFGLLIWILILCKRSRRYCVSCPDSESLPSFMALSKSKFKYNSSHSEYTTEKAKLASV